MRFSSSAWRKKHSLGPCLCGTSSFSCPSPIDHKWLDMRSDQIESHVSMPGFLSGIPCQNSELLPPRLSESASTWTAFLGQTEHAKGERAAGRSIFETPETCWCSAGNEGMTLLNHPLAPFQGIPFIPTFPTEHQQLNDIFEEYIYIYIYDKQKLVWCLKGVQSTRNGSQTSELQG